ncbi:hypothetical protein QNH25_01445 [Bacillus safensis]|uniref:hypothetical protein n=1 Tax=Bacillus TaxID=1386 RepID=UPI001BCFD764|nr:MULTISPECIES: hypothetical protein [Bacillus]WHX75659.1 hypothetical protein QNH25_01445 [Bacillus safensis]WHX83118.1 hypothetical protein QNH21_01445 [Bacillus safensis]WNF51109.1 hypothetical protein RHP70_01415 [Bacillus sp. SG20001]
MSKKKKSFLQLILIFSLICFSFSSTAGVSAKEGDSSIVPIKGDAAAEMVNIALDAIENGEVKAIAPVDTYGLKKSSVYKVGGGVTAVTVPINGDYSLPSNITLFIDEDHTVLQANEMLVTKNDKGNFKVETYVDGSLVKSVDTELSYMSDEELLAENPPEIQTQGVKAKAACIASVLGIGSGAAYLIAVGCAGSCAAPTPVTAPICAACIGAYAVLGAGGMGAVVACFKL